MKPNEIPGIGELSIPEKILLVEDLWDAIVSEESTVTVPQSHKEELDRRFESYRGEPGRLLTLDDLLARVEKRK